MPNETIDLIEDSNNAEQNVEGQKTILNNQ